MDIDELIKNMEMPDVRPYDINDEGNTLIGYSRRLFMAYAFMQCPSLDDGDISITKETDGDEILNIRKCDMPKSVEEFIDKVVSVEGTQYHAQGIVKKKLKTGEGEDLDIDFVLSLATEGYSFMSPLFTGNSKCGVYFHAGCMPDKELVDKIIKETTDGFEKIMNGSSKLN